jgi:putative transposase
MKRVAAPERTRERLRALMDGRLGTAPERSNLVLLAAQLILEEALEAEVRDEVGRGRYERVDGEASGYRNGYRTGRMKTAEGVVEFAAPQVRDTAEPFVSGIRQHLAGRTGALEDLAVELYARGLSTRDIEDALTDEAAGAEPGAAADEIFPKSMRAIRRSLENVPWKPLRLQAWCWRSGA